MSFNTSEGWSRDVSEEVAEELRQRCADRGGEVPPSLEDFLDRYQPRQLPVSSIFRCIGRAVPDLSQFAHGFIYTPVCLAPSTFACRPVRPPSPTAPIGSMK